MLLACRVHFNTIIAQQLDRERFQLIIIDKVHKTPPWSETIPIYKFTG